MNDLGKKNIKVSINRMSMAMDASEFYNTEDMRSKFQEIRKFKQKVIDNKGVNQTSKTENN